MNRTTTVIDLVALTALLAAAIVVTRTTHFTPLWTDVVVYTVGVFGIVIVVLRSEWRHTRFWPTLLLLFALHVLVVMVIVQAIPRNWAGIPGAFQLFGGIAEALIIANVLWLRTRVIRH